MVFVIITSARPGCRASRMCWGGGVWGYGWGRGMATDLPQVCSRVGRCTYTWPGSNWRPSACEADVIATRPQVLCAATSVPFQTTRSERSRIGHCGFRDTLGAAGHSCIGGGVEGWPSLGCWVVGYREAWPGVVSRSMVVRCGVTGFRCLFWVCESALHRVALLCCGWRAVALQCNAVAQCVKVWRARA